MSRINEGSNTWPYRSEMQVNPKGEKVGGRIGGEVEKLGLGRKEFLDTETMSG